MEAWRRSGSGASMPPPAAYKFAPTDADIVAHYLLPRAAGGLPIPHPHARAVIDADPCSCPPWELLRRHGHAVGSDRAFFFFRPVPKSKTTKTGRRLAKRAVPEGEEGGGGAWVLYRPAVEGLVLLRRGGVATGGGETEFRYKKRSLRYRSNEDPRATGWIMDEYEITDPPLPGAVLSRVMLTGKKKRQEPQAAAAAAAQLLAPGPEQPGPSNYLDGDDDDDDNSGGFMGEMAGYCSALPGAGEDGGYYVGNSYFGNNYCFNEGDGSGYCFLHDDGGDGD